MTIERYAHYSMDIQWDEEDRIYIVTVPELPGCQTHGETLEEAIYQGQDAIDSWIDAGLAWGHRIPEPRVLRRRNRNLASKAS